MKSESYLSPSCPRSLSLGSRMLGCTASVAVVLSSLMAPYGTIQASSHSDAPLIKLDPQANLTDVYAFIRQRPNGEQALVVEVNVRPFSEPGDGVMYDAFSPDALYSIHITHPVTGVETQRFDFQFSSPDIGSGGYKNPNTILRYGNGGAPIATVGDAGQNFTQTYTVAKTANGTRTLLPGATLQVAPPNVGVRTTPSYNDPATGKAISGAVTRNDLDPYTKQTTVDRTLGGVTYTLFCGPREDAFYADTPAIFDLLDSRIVDNQSGPQKIMPGLGQQGNGVDGFKGYNVLHYAIVIPISSLTPAQYTGALQSPALGVGVYASVSRPRTTLRSAGGPDVSSGPYVQVNRLANPLFNEVLVALADKDKYNRTLPPADAVNFAKYALNPELAGLINLVFGTGFQTTNRADLQAIYIPDVIRVNTTTGPTRTSGDPGFNRLSFLGGDLLGGVPAGWPNGRRFGDDVVDIALTAVANGPAFASPLLILGDNVDTNDQVHNRTFPYAATPHAGPRNSKDSGPNAAD